MGLPVIGFPDYVVEDDGRVFSKKTQKYLKQSDCNGYRTVELFNNGRSKRILVHRIVAEAYIPNPDNLPQVNHKDENRANNTASNLEWCTAKYNMNYGIGAKTRHSKIDYSNPVFRENAIKNGKLVSVPVMQFSKCGAFIARFESVADATRSLGLKHSHISECASGKRPSANGYVWKYERSDDLSECQF